MERALVIVGKQEDNTENYQLLIGCNYTSESYDQSSDHQEFLDETSQLFAERILDSGLTLEIGFVNGRYLDEDLGKLIGVSPLSPDTVKYFRQQLSSTLIKLSEGRALAIPISSN